MQTLLTISMLALLCGGALSQTSCDFTRLSQLLHSKTISQDIYTRIYTRCITGQGAATLPSGNGFQPSCSQDVAVVKAIAKFSKAGQFTAADGQMYPYSVKGVVTLTQTDEFHTRIHAVISGTHSFLFDSDQFSMHVHQKGEIDEGCLATGGHYNPCGKNHSNDPLAADRHVGDVAKVTIPSTFTTAQDILTITKIDTQVKLSGPLSVLGRSITVHGGSGATRVGCGTIAVTDWEGVDHPDSTYSSTNPFWN